MTAMNVLVGDDVLGVGDADVGLGLVVEGHELDLPARLLRLPLNFSTASCVPSLMPSPSAAWPPESGLWVAILTVPLPWASTGEAAGTKPTASARQRTRTPRMK